MSLLGFIGGFRTWDDYHFNDFYLIFYRILINHNKNLLDTCNNRFRIERKKIYYSGIWTTTFNLTCQGFWDQIFHSISFILYSYIIFNRTVPKNQRYTLPLRWSFPHLNYEVELLHLAPLYLCPCSNDCRSPYNKKTKRDFTRSEPSCSKTLNSAQRRRN